MRNRPGATRGLPGAVGGLSRMPPRTATEPARWRAEERIADGAKADTRGRHRDSMTGTDSTAAREYAGSRVLISGELSQMSSTLRGGRESTFSNQLLRLARLRFRNCGSWGNTPLRNPLRHPRRWCAAQERVSAASSHFDAWIGSPRGDSLASRSRRLRSERTMTTLGPADDYVGPTAHCPNWWAPLQSWAET